MPDLTQGRPMMKWLLHLLMVCFVAGIWAVFWYKGQEIEQLKVTQMAQEEMGDPESRVASLRTEIESMEGERTFTGILLTFLTSGLVGVLFVVYLLPFFAHRVTHAVYDSGEMVEQDVMHDARSLVAQGDYEGAVEAFKKAAAKDPLNRLPWVEMAKIYMNHLHNPAAAIETIRHALRSQEWEISDAAYFLFRLAEMYEQVEGDRATAKAIMQQVVDEFPNTRHSANATHKLHEWQLQEEEAAVAVGAEVPDESA